MSTTPEGKVKAKVVAFLKKEGAYYFFPATHGYGRSGVPDIVGCIEGKFFAIECKAGSNKATALQIREIETIRATGGAAAIVNEQNLDSLPEWFRRVRAGAWTLS